MKWNYVIFSLLILGVLLLSCAKLPSPSPPPQAPLPAEPSPPVISPRLGLEMPEDGSLVSSVMPVLRWNCSALGASYRLQVALDPGFNSVIVDETGIVETNYTLPTGRLLRDKVYYWRVNASGDGITSEWSTCWSFRTPATKSNIIHYQFYPRWSWDRVPDITILARTNDPRIKLAAEAVDFWNQQLTDIGTPFRLGTITHTTELVSISYLESLSSALMAMKPCPEIPESVKKIRGDIIIAMSDGAFISFVAWLEGGVQPIISTSPKQGPQITMQKGSRVLIGIRHGESFPMNLPNVARNLIAHEIGHAIGLGHNNDKTKLMCGRPAPCQPPDFQSNTEYFFPLTEEEKAFLLELYPMTWEPITR